MAYGCANGMYVHQQWQFRTNECQMILRFAYVRACGRRNPPSSVCRAGCEPTSILGIVEVCGVGLASVVGFITLLVGCDRCHGERGTRSQSHSK